MAHLFELADAAQKQVIGHIDVLVRGLAGTSRAGAVNAYGLTLGPDLQKLKSSSSFRLQMHEGVRLLHVPHGIGALPVNGVDHQLRCGQPVFEPAVYPHGQRGPGSGDRLGIHLFSNPHHTIDSAKRMIVVRDETHRPA